MNTVQTLELSVRRAYSQRGNLAVAFAKMAIALGCHAGRGLDNKTENDMDWRHVLYIDLPTGEQVSYHFAPIDVNMLDGLPCYRGEWDGKFTSAEEWHKLIYPPCAADLLPLEEYAEQSGLSPLAYRRWSIEKEKLEADEDVAPADRERILRGYVKAWSR